MHRANIGVRVEAAHLAQEEGAEEVHSRRPRADELEGAILVGRAEAADKALDIRI